MRHKQDRKELECDPVWHPVAVSTVRHCATSKFKPTVGVLLTEPVVKWQHQAHTSKSTAPQKEMCHSGEPVPSSEQAAISKVSSELALEMNLTVHLGSTFFGVHLDSTFVWTCE